MAHVALTIVLISYALLFWHQETTAQHKAVQLSYPLPAPLQQAALGYLRQLGGELIFVKTSVFLGGTEAGRDPKTYADSLAENLNAATTLHPQFIDNYYLCESSLPHIDEASAGRANDILQTGLEAVPEHWQLPFFIGFNHFQHLNDSKTAAKYLYQAANKPEGPRWLAHLAGTLAAEGGDIYGGLMWLKAMLAGEEDASMRERYGNSIKQFERAILVQQAIDRYKTQQGQHPETLQSLIPQFLASLPEIDPPFVLSWNPPKLSLLREKTTN